MRRRNEFVMPTKNAHGIVARDFSGRDFPQIFVADFPDVNNSRIADPVE